MRTSARRPLAFLASLTVAVTGLLLPAAALAPAAAAAPAPGGTLLFIKGGNIWIARGDGTGQVPVTTDGSTTRPYHSPTQADDGTIAAGRGDLIVRLSRDGVRLNSFDPPPLTSSVGHPLGGQPHDIAISPDGTKIAWSETAYQCPIAWSCMVRYATGYTRSDRFQTVAPQTYFRAASWVTNDRTVQGGGYLSQTMLHRLGSEPVHWFDDSEMYESSTDLSSHEVSRDGRWLVSLRGYSDTTQVIWYRISGSTATQLPPVMPTAVCNTGTDPAFRNPTLAPDGSAAAWEEGDGIWVKVDLADCTVQPRRVIPGATDPSWSKAGYRVPVRTFTAGRAPAVSGTTKVGRTLHATVGTTTPAATSYSYVWRRNGKAVAGATRATYRLTNADAGRRISVTVTAHRSGHTNLTRTSATRTVAFRMLAKPKVRGTVKVGRTLKADRGRWAGSPTSYRYQWYRGTKKIKGATKTTYRLRTVDRGAKIRVKVTVRRAGVPTATVLTASTKRVAR